MIVGDELVRGAASLGIDLSDEQVDRFEAYLEGLRQWNTHTNLTSRAALDDAVRVHALDSLALVPIIRQVAPSGSRLADVGSGAGFPGLALKIALPKLEATLIEATGKKAGFLEWTVGRLGLTGVEVLAERAEAVGHRDGYREAFDIVTARALGGLSTVLELTLPLCSVGGSVLAPRGADAVSETDAAGSVCMQLGGGIATAVRAPERGVVNNVAVVVVPKTGPTPARYPRRDGVPAKRPLV